LDEKISRQDRCHRPTSADYRRVNIGMAIRSKCLQGLQQHRDGHKRAPGQDWPAPNEAEHQREREITKEVVDPPTKARAWYPFLWAEGGKYQQEAGGHAAKL
jgi:hypothetical protein